MSDSEKPRLTMKDVSEAMAQLLKRGRQDWTRPYYVMLEGVELFIDPTCVHLSVIIPYGAKVEIGGSPALDWVAQACREKAEREGTNE